MNYSYQTHEGKRKDNQDFTGVFFNQSNLLLAILCDGLGGHQAGDIASEMAVSQIGNAWAQTDFTEIDTYLIQSWLDQRINQENTRIYDAASTYSDLDGMGTTLVATVVLKDQVLFANVGDSRAYTYAYEENVLALVTEDHSFVSELKRRGGLTNDEAANHLNKNALTRSLGVPDKVEVDFFKRLRNDIDLIMLNSDGLSNVVSKAEITDILENEQASLAEKAEKLIEIALYNEGSDNITVNLIDLVENPTEEAGADV